jgi:hypothetical protein
LLPIRTQPRRQEAEAKANAAAKAAETAASAAEAAAATAASLAARQAEAHEALKKRLEDAEVCIEQAAAEAEAKASAAAKAAETAAAQAIVDVAAYEALHQLHQPEMFEPGGDWPMEEGPPTPMLEEPPATQEQEAQLQTCADQWTSKRKNTDGARVARMNVEDGGMNKAAIEGNLSAGLGEQIDNTHRIDLVVRLTGRPVHSGLKLLQVGEYATTEVDQPRVDKGKSLDPRQYAVSLVRYVDGTEGPLVLWRSPLVNPENPEEVVWTWFASKRSDGAWVTHVAVSSPLV